MSTIERYIFRRAFAMFAATLGAVATIAWITQALGRVNVISDSSGSVVAFLKIASLTLPQATQEVIPFAAAIGLAQTLAAMNTDSELAVINASGAGRMTVIRPALVLAVLASLSVLALETTLTPLSFRTMRSVISESRGDLLTSVIQEGGFSRIEKNLFVQVAERKPGGLLSGIFVADQRDPKMELVYYAKDGAVLKEDGNSILVMSDGEVHRRASGGDLSVVRFTSYAFNLDSLKTDSGGGVVLFPRDRPMLYILNPPSDDAVLKRQPGLFRAEANRRLTSWLNPFIFLLIVVAVAGNPISHRQARIPPLLMVLAFGGTLRWATFFFESRSSTSIAFAWAQFGLPIAALLTVIGVIAANRRLKATLGLAERASDILNYLARRFPALQRRLAALRPRGAAS